MRTVLMTGFLVVALVVAALGQGQHKMMAFKAIEIPELGAMVVGAEAGPKIDFVAPDEARLEAYRGIDVQLGDVIVSANGERISDLDALIALIDGAQPGDTIRLALKRGKSFAVAAYVVATPEVADAASEAAAESRDAHMADMGGPGGQARVLKIESDANVVPFIDLSVLLSDSDDGVSVFETIEMPRFITEDIELKVGDRITALQGVDVSSCEAMMTSYSDIAVGESVKLTIDRDGESLNLTFTKPKSPGMVKMQKKM